MTDAESLEIAVARTGHARFRELLDPAHADYDPRYWDVVREVAGREPSWYEKAANFAGSVVEHVAAGLPILSDDASAARLAVCAGCEHFTAERACRLCGCAMDVKVRWREQKCPINKW